MSYFHYPFPLTTGWDILSKFIVRVMKVLQVNPYPPDHLGGSEIFCKNLSINLKKNLIDNPHSLDKII